MGNPSPNMSGLSPWRPGQSGNPAGRKPGAYPADALKSMMTLPVEEIEAIKTDRRETLSRRAAASLALQTVSGSRSDQRQAFAEVADRTSGKAIQSVVVAQRESRDAGQILADLRQRCASRESAARPAPPNDLALSKD